MPTLIRTKRGLRIAAAAAVLAGAAAVQPAGAQEPANSVSVDVSECVKLTTPEERLACFEEQVKDARGNPTASGAPELSSSPPAVADSSSDRALERENDDKPPDIYGKVVELRETVPNAYLITLDNGQVWRQTVPKMYELRPGYPVRIYLSRWRTYRLTNEGLRSFIQVERVR